MYKVQSAFKCDLVKTAVLSCCLSLSLAQRHEKLLLILMYKLSHKGMCHKITNRATRQQEEYVFKMDTNIGKTYEKSPDYIETKLWNKLPKETQFSDNVFEF